MLSFNPLCQCYSKVLLIFSSLIPVSLTLLTLYFFVSNKSPSCGYHYFTNYLWRSSLSVKSVAQSSKRVGLAERMGQTQEIYLKGFTSHMRPNVSGLFIYFFLTWWSTVFIDLFVSVINNVFMFTGQLCSDTKLWLGLRKWFQLTFSQCCLVTVGYGVDFPQKHKSVLQCQVFYCSVFCINFFFSQLQWHTWSKLFITTPK